MSWNINLAAADSDISFGFILRRYWAAQLADKLNDTQWLHKFLHPGGKQSEKIRKRDLNIFFVKLHLLDPTTVFPAFQTLQKSKWFRTDRLKNV